MAEIHTLRFRQPNPADSARSALLLAQRVAEAEPELLVPAGATDECGSCSAAALLDAAAKHVQAADALAACLIDAAAGAR